MSVSKPKIFLTGGNGMVGKNILDHELAGCYEIYAPSRTDVDMCNYGSILTSIAEFKPDILLHCAGRVGGIRANMSAPLDFLVENLDIGRNVVLASAAVGVPRLINLASSCMYPKDIDGYLSEDMIMTGSLEPTNEGYALAKIVVARLCEYVSKTNEKLRYKTVVPCNLYGKFDKFDVQNAHLIPAIISKIHSAKQAGLDTVEIWGDGTARREFLYAGDLADALIGMIDRFENLPDLMNVGVGSDHTITEYYQAVAQVLEFDGAFSFDLSKPVGMARKLVSVARQTEWGWSPATDLISGIEKTVAWYGENYKGTN
ncbi:GDP-L-fucose synthase [Alphaproteobacteria bacterium]|nr:GDP-L-fucose synthase [Alphaproteobacteria bacterium]